ncbi:MAG: ComEC/Rec2 family competence protein [Pyrinomonadaceae bacterium]
MPLAAVFDQRRRLIDNLRANFDAPTAGIMIASLLGDKYFVDRETGNAFREGGTFHILVISGVHITFIGGLLFFFAGKFTRRRSLQFIFSAGILWAYTVAVGADIPVMRASLVFTFLAFSRLLDRKSSPLNSLGACALVLLAVRPSSVFTASFQLTFLSVAAIVGIAFPLIGKLRAIGKWMPGAAQPFPPSVSTGLRKFAETLYWNETSWSIESKRQIWSAGLFKSPALDLSLHPHIRSAAAYLFEGLLVSAIIQVCLIPLSVYYFHRVSFAGLLLNLWVGVLLAFESFAVAAGIAVAAVSQTLAEPIIRLAETLNAPLLYFPKLFADSGWASIRLPIYPGYGRVIYVIYFLPVIAIAVAVQRWDPFAVKALSASVTRMRVAPMGFLLAALAALVIFHPLSSPKPDGKLHVDFLDVGQGDSAFVTFPNGETLLIDGGGKPDFRTEGSFQPDVQTIGESVVSPFLWERGYSRVDHLLATHADTDHIQGLNAVAANFAVGDALFGREPSDDPEFAELAAVLAKRGIASRAISRGDATEIGGVRVEFLWPEAESLPNSPSDNDHSVVTMLTFGERRILLTGDIERAAESAIDAGGELNADVVKVPHHGSRTSSTAGFVHAVRPSIAVVSVGKRSRFGHPHPEVIDRWRAAGATVLTTGQNGAISVETDGHEMSLRTFVEQK